MDKILDDIIHIEESTYAYEIDKGVMQATAESDLEKFKVQNIRDSYGGTKEAQAEVPANLGATILSRSKTRTGLLICQA